MAPQPSQASPDFVSGAPPHALSEPLLSWCGTSSAYPREKSISQVFEEIVAERPQSIALVSKLEKCTYQELNSRANRLARVLQSRGVGPDVMVACCIERSVNLIVVLLAILKAGGAYVPVDPSYPKDRLDVLLRDTNTQILVTQRSFATDLFADFGGLPLCVEDSVATETGNDNENLVPASGARNLAYVVYTSGSTGQPKGVMVENRSVVRLVRNTNYCRFGPDETFLQFAPISFDAATFEIWGSLLNGGHLVLMPSNASSLEDLGSAIRENGVTTLWLTSGLFNLMVDQRLEDLRSVQQLLAGGDVLSSRHARTFLEAFPNSYVINGYGPTENTTFTTAHKMSAGEEVPQSVPIGKPISNTRVYILDRDLELVPPGQIGELYAAGDGVARGYLNDPVATAAKFLPDPFSKRSDERMLRTGDLARWRADGLIEFMGRIDDQIKILGHRIEPGEIETVLRSHPAVADVCVVSQVEQGGSKRLIAYYVPRSPSGSDASSLREFLAAKLPSFMIPAVWISVDSLPLSWNGKIDRKALSSRRSDAADGPSSTPVPVSDLEQMIAGVWQKALNLRQVGLDDNFFDIGGDSLLLLSAHAQLQKVVQTPLTITDLFEFTTVRKLAACLSEKQAVAPQFSDVQDRAQKQRAAFAMHRERRPGGAS